MHRAVKKMLLLSSKVGPNWGLEALSRVLQAIHASSQSQKKSRIIHSLPKKTLVSMISMAILWAKFC